MMRDGSERIAEGAELRAGFKAGPYEMRHQTLLMRLVGLAG